MLSSTQSAAPLIDAQWRDLAIAPLDAQRAALETIVRGDPDLLAILALIRDLNLPDGWLLAGAVYQTVWNVICRYPRRRGIKDYDIGYFDDADLSYEAEDRIIRSVAAHAPDGLNIEVRNQARVHLWFEQRFGFPVPPLRSTIEAQTRYASSTHAVGVRLRGDALDVSAPFGLRDIFAMQIRPNRLLPNRDSHNAKAERCKAVWPHITVEWW